MDDDNDVIYQGDILKLSETRKRFVGSKVDTWKPKYIILRKKGDKPLLEYHKKKPKNAKKLDRTLTDSFELWPSYKVEKLRDARGRDFVCEITSSTFHLFLSTNTEQELNILVFLLQVQIRLKDNIKDDVIIVVPEESESQNKIGAKGSRCVLHASPWGLTLALEKTRALLAQWPLKSIRYYETSGSGLFNIEAGRVAPMGEGLYSFRTQKGDDDYMYDLVDNYIINTLDRVNPTQKGTPEEIADYIREHDHLHSLTTISITTRRTPEIRNILKRVWNIGSYTSEGSAESATETLRGWEARARQDSTAASVTSTPSMGRESRSTSASSSLVINLERPSDLNLSHSDTTSLASVHSSQPDRTQRDGRPPLPSRQGGHGTGAKGGPRRSRRRDHSIPRKIDAVDASDGESVSLSSEGSSLNLSVVGSTPRRHSNPANVMHRIQPDVSLPAADYPKTLPRYQNIPQGQQTQFYNLSSPNMKVRVSKSPMITRNPNKVGRAELLMERQQSGVKSPGSPSPSKHVDRWDFRAGEDDHQEALDYMDAVAKASQQKYGHSSIDRRWGKLQRKLSSNSHSGNTSLPASPPSVHRPSGGYVNMPDKAIHHGRQRSADSVMLSQGPTGSAMRQESVESNNDGTLSPPVVRHNRQRSADELSSRTSQGSAIDAASQERPRSARSSRHDDPHHSRQNSLTSTTSGRNRSRGDSEGEVQALSKLKIPHEQGDVEEWLISASCEDLSDHMRTVIYDDQDPTNTYEEIDSTRAERYQSNAEAKAALLDNSMEDKPPLPFTGLKKYQAPTEHRDRSKSFGYMNVNNLGQVNTNSKPVSSAPSAHLIRKMMNARNKQDTLRKSLSNPNFLNLGSKEHLFNLKSVNNSNNKLAAGTKQKSRSFGSLFPAIKRAFSRESLGHSRSTTPERRASFSGRRKSKDSTNQSEFQRQSSFHSTGEINVKGIRMSARSRSFSRIRGAKSLEALSKSRDSSASRLSSGTAVSAPDGTGDRTSTITSVSAPGESTEDSKIQKESSTPEKSSEGEADLRRSSSSKSSSRKSPGSSSSRPGSAKHGSIRSAATNPGYISSTYIALSPPDLPPLPSPVLSPLDSPSSPSSISNSSVPLEEAPLPPMLHLDKAPSRQLTDKSLSEGPPPPLPAPRQKSTPPPSMPHSKPPSSSSSRKSREGRKGSLSASNSSSSQTISSTEGDANKVEKRPHVSDIVAKLEENNNNSPSSNRSSVISEKQGSVQARSDSCSSSSSSSKSKTVECPFQPIPFRVPTVQNGVNPPSQLKKSKSKPPKS